LHQGNAVLGGDRLVFDFQLLAGGLFQVGDDALAQLDVVARVLAVSEGIGQAPDESRTPIVTLPEALTLAIVSLA
jgi:hypothetical protein